MRAIEKTANDLVVCASIGGEPQTFHTDVVVHGAIRVPEIEDLNLSVEHIDACEKGVEMNEYLQQHVKSSRRVRGP